MTRAAFLALAAALALPVFAQTGYTTVVFTAVDAVSLRSSGIQITGVPEGAAAPVTSTWSVYSASYAEACERYALLAMERPGRYRLEVLSSGSSLQYCRLVRAAP